MRALILAPLLCASSLALAACAGGPGGMNSYSREVEQIRLACEGRGGIIQPTGRISGAPALDHPCIIRQPTGLPPSP